MFVLPEYGPKFFQGLLDVLLRATSNQFFKKAQDCWHIILFTGYEMTMVARIPQI